MPRQQQGVLGSGQRHIQQSPLLVTAPHGEDILVLRDLVGQRFTIVHVAGVQHRYAVLGQRGPVATQQRRQLAGIGEPGPRHRGGREDPSAQVRYRDDLPFQALGGVHGEDLDPVGGDSHLGRSEPVLDIGSNVQIGQQAGR